MNEENKDPRAAADGSSPLGLDVPAVRLTARTITGKTIITRDSELGRGLAEALGIDTNTPALLFRRRNTLTPPKTLR